MIQVPDENVFEVRPLPAPAELLNSLPRTEAQTEMVARSRQTIRRILTGADPRLLTIVGPCSIHDLKAGREYAQRLSTLSRELGDRMFFVMRVYLEKPRTTVGWKGLIMDPYLDGSGDISRGLSVARQFLREVLDYGLPTATEFLDPISPQYIGDLVSWVAMGARTSESQLHRQLASGLSMPMGFKNGTDGSIQHAVNAIKAARQPDTFLGITLDGQPAAVSTCGNQHCHVVLRGGASGPNYSASHIATAETLLEKAGLPKAIMVDCSHDNSGRQPARQPEILKNLVHQIAKGNRSLMGVMMESNLFAGNQAVPASPRDLKYGISITDACLDWTTTEHALREAHAALAPRFAPAKARVASSELEFMPIPNA